MSHFARNLLLIALPAALALPLAASDQRSWKFTSFDYPNALTTSAYGINAGGVMVGIYTDPTGRMRGFQRRDGALTPIDYPGAFFTMPAGINDHGDIVGAQSMNPGLPGMGLHGFILQQGSFTAIPDYPGHLNTVPMRITNSGVIVGCYHDTDFGPTMHAMKYTNGTYSSLSSGPTMNMGVAPDGIVTVGVYGTTIPPGQPMHGLVATGDKYVLFDFPFALSTVGTDMNGSGDIVGIYIDSAMKSHGFLLHTDAVSLFGSNPLPGINGGFEFTTIDYPGAIATEIWGLNAKGDMVGDYTDAAGKVHAFFLSQSASLK